MVTLYPLISPFCPLAGTSDHDILMLVDDWAVALIWAGPELGTKTVNHTVIFHEHLPTTQVP